MRFSEWVRKSCVTWNRFVSVYYLKKKRKKRFVSNSVYNRRKFCYLFGVQAILSYSHIEIYFLVHCSYGNMALFYHGLNQAELALRHMSQALLLLSLSSGPDHPDVAATFLNVAMMCHIGNMNTAFSPGMCLSKI